MKTRPSEATTMLCFLPPVPAIRPDPLPDRGSPQAARAAQAVILIFVVLNVLFVLTGLLPILVKNEARDHGAPAKPRSAATCLDRNAPISISCSAAQHAISPR